LFHLLFADQGFNDFVQFSVQNLLKVVKTQIDPVVGDSVLGKIVGANLFRPLTAAYLHPPFFVYTFGLLSLLHVKQPGPKYCHGLHPIPYLRPFILAGSHYAGGQVRETDCRTYFIHILPAGTSGVEKFHFEIVRTNVELDLFCLR
jgi:hypothetical protein